MIPLLWKSLASSARPRSASAIASLVLPLLLLKAGIEHLREDDQKREIL